MAAPRIDELDILVADLVRQTQKLTEIAEADRIGPQRLLQAVDARQRAVENLKDVVDFLTPDHLERLAQTHAQAQATMQSLAQHRACVADQLHRVRRSDTAAPAQARLVSQTA